MIPCLIPPLTPPTCFDKPAVNVERCFIFVGCQLVLVTSTKTPLETPERQREWERESRYGEREEGRKTVINRADNIRVSKQLETGNCELHSQPSFVNK